jgi:hypothetical protein
MSRGISRVRQVADIRQEKGTQKLSAAVSAGLLPNICVFYHKPAMCVATTGLRLPADSFPAFEGPAFFLFHQARLIYSYE